MSALRTQVKEKRTIMREIYGGMMSLTDLAKELGMKPEAARAWAREAGIGNRIGSRIKYDTDEVARVLVNGRGMC